MVAYKLFAYEKIKVYLDNSKNLENKELLPLYWILSKTIFGLEPARFLLKCDVSELKDELF